MTPISFEFYPPKTDEQRGQLDRAAARLKTYAPEYVSCTFGAGGSTQDGTLDFTVPKRPIRKVHKGIPAFTTLRGGAYFFMPGLRGLRYLATLEG